MPRLPHSEIDTSDIGIGCAYLTAGSLTRYELRLIDAAFEAGARHFDVAPQYGLGTAEKVLGLALKGKRDRVTITTKAGIIRPNVPYYKLLARSLLSPLRTRLRAANNKVDVKRINSLIGLSRKLDFSSNTIRKSFEESLGHLKTDYVDIFMLHNAQPNDVSSELINTIVDFKISGKSINIGLATDLVATQSILRNYPGVFDCVQYSWSVLDPRLSQDLGEPFRITHRALARALGPVSKWLADNSQILDYLCSETGYDFTNQGVLAQALIGASLIENEGGISLIASRTIERTRENVLTALDPETRRIGQVLLRVIFQSNQLPSVVE
jgi:D-threo-aldose 1-dehydrogenase